jgi:DNA-binding NarL/FixJ family response regulator
MIKVLIADDEPLIRAGIAAVLESAADVVVVAEAGDGRAAVEAARASRPDVALLDIKMPVLDGLAAIGEIRRHVPGTRIVMLTSFGTQPNAQRAIRAGTAGFVLKSCAPDELIRAVRAAHAGQAYLSPAVTRFVLDMIPHADVVRGQAAAARLAVLSPRESQVMSLLAEGLPNGSIARRLRMTEASAKTYVSRILAKLGCANRVQAALLARDAGLPRPADSPAAGPDDVTRSAAAGVRRP